MSFLSSELNNNTEFAEPEELGRRMRTFRVALGPPLALIVLALLTDTEGSHGTISFLGHPPRCTGLLLRGGGPKGKKDKEGEGKALEITDEAQSGPVTSAQHDHPLAQLNTPEGDNPRESTVDEMKVQALRNIGSSLRR